MSHGYGWLVHNKSKQKWGIDISMRFEILSQS